MANQITKDIFLSSCECLTHGWYLRTHHHSETTLSHADQFRMNEGIQIGLLARSLYPEGVLVQSEANKENAEITSQLMNDAKVSVIFEATFMTDDLIAKADILIREKDGWHLIEVKSGSASNVVKPEYLNDIAYTTFVMNSCNIKLTNASLYLVSKDFRRGMNVKKFFVDIDCTNMIVALASGFNLIQQEILRTTNMLTRPAPELIYACKHCDFYATCLGRNIKNPIFDLPYLKESKFNQLKELDISCVEAIPGDIKLSDKQKEVRTAVLDNKPIIHQEKLQQALNKIIFPAFYLDFEAVSTAIPLYANVAPYEEIITQYSIHKYSSLGTLEKHCEYLADQSKDNRRQLAEQLIHDIENAGSVIVYHAGAEIKYLNNLAELFPDLARRLRAIQARIVDLKVILRSCYYHPDFHGSFSIKVVLPVLVPTMSYQDLSIGDGQTASVVFAELVRGIYPPEQISEIRQHLLSYCKQDTLAMVKIHERLRECLKNGAPSLV